MYSQLIVQISSETIFDAGVIGLLRNAKSPRRSHCRGEAEWFRCTTSEMSKLSTRSF